MRPTYSDHAQAQRGDESLKDQNRSGKSGTLTIAQPHAEENHRSESWRLIPCCVVLLSFVFLAACDFINGREIPDWKSVLALADTARDRGELHYAKSLYLQVGRLAASRHDWAGLLAAACGIKKHDRGRGRHSATNMLLLRALVVAEAEQSRSGIAAVGKAFSVLGEDKVASMVLSRIPINWIDKTDDSADVASPDCWEN